MQDHERGLLYVIVFGGLIGLGKLLVSEERITP